MERGIITAAITHQPWLMGSLSLDILSQNPVLRGAVDEILQFHNEGLLQIGFLFIV